MGSEQVLLFQVRVDMGVMAMNGYFTFSERPGLESYQRMV